MNVAIAVGGRKGGGGFAEKSLFLVLKSYGSKQIWLPCNFLGQECSTFWEVLWRCESRSRPLLVEVPHHWRRDTRSLGAAIRGPLAPRYEVPCAAIRGPLRRHTRSHVAPRYEVPGDKKKPKNLGFRAFIEPSDQNQLYHTSLLSKIWVLTENKKKCERSL